MPRQNKIEIEAKVIGKTPVEMLEALFEIYGNQSAVAKALGVRQPAISIALAKYGLKQKIVLISTRNNE